MTIYSFRQHIQHLFEFFRDGFLCKEVMESELTKSREEVGNTHHLGGKGDYGAKYGQVEYNDSSAIISTARSNDDDDEI
jgi:hypothetical protein